MAAPKLAENIHNQTLLIGSKFKFFCYLQASGSRPLHFEWLKDGQILRHYGDRLTSYTIATTEDDTLFSIDKIRLNDSGNYTCLVRNSYGSDSKTISLTIKGIFIHFESEFMCGAFFDILIFFVVVVVVRSDHCFYYCFITNDSVICFTDVILS